MPPQEPAREPRRVRKSGSYFRAADQHWTEPLDTNYSKKTGGRWNAPDRFGVLYLNEDVETARGYIRHLHADKPYGPEDLARPPILVTVEVLEDNYVDVESADGVQAVGLPANYPRAVPETDEIVTHAVCQPIGQALYDAGELGIACRSANSAEGEGSELAWFDQPGRVAPAEQHRQNFDDWYWGAEPD